MNVTHDGDFHGSYDLEFHGSAFVPAGGNVPYQSTAPSAIATGDLWIDSDTGQLFFYNGTYY